MIKQISVMPDNGIGNWYEVEITDPDILQRIKGGTHLLRLEVNPGPQANGVAIYGRETKTNKQAKPDQREKVEDPGPMEIIASR